MTADPSSRVPVPPAVERAAPGAIPPAPGAPIDSTSPERQAWREDRRSGLGGSDIAGILGLSPWASPYSVWLDKTAGRTEEVDEAQQAIFDRGHDAEPYLELQFRRKHPDLVIADRQERISARAGWAYCHPDGLVYCGHADIDSDDPEPVGVWEAKTSNDFAPWADVPAHYQCQVQWAIWLADVPRAYVTVGFAGWKTETYIIDRDDDDIALIVDAAGKFWDEHVVAGVAPDVDAHSATGRALKARYPEHDDELEAALDRHDVELWRTLKADEKGVKADLVAVQNRLAAALGDAAVGLVNGEPAMTYRTQTRTTTCTECGHTKQSQPFRVWRNTTKET